MKESVEQIYACELSSVSIMDQLAKSLPCAPRPRHMEKGALAGVRNELADQVADPREKAAKLWLDQAFGEPWLVAERKIMAAMRVTFASPEHEAVAAHALEWILGRPKVDKGVGLVFFGSMQRDENCSFLPLSMVASEAGGKMAGVLAKASVEDLRALGEGICPDRPAAGAAQLAAAASANSACPQELRGLALAALAEICSEDPRAGQFALLSLDSPGSGEEAGISFGWPAAKDYKKAFAGSALEREALLHLLARHREGDKLLAWCSEAGFEGAHWPCSRAACVIGIEEGGLLDGLAETDANRLRVDEKSLFQKLGGQEENIGEEDRSALAREFGNQPSLALAAMNKAPWITRQVYDKPERAASSWMALNERARRLETIWADRSLDDVAAPMILDLARVVGLGDLPPEAAWAKEAMQRYIHMLRKAPAPSVGKRVAEIESLLIASEAIPRAPGNKPRAL